MTEIVKVDNLLNVLETKEKDIKKEIKEEKKKIKKAIKEKNKDEKTELAKKVKIENYRKQYYINNKEELLKKMNAPVLCDCGKMVKNSYLKTHMSSEKCKLTTYKIRNDKRLIKKE